MQKFAALILTVVLCGGMAYAQVPGGNIFVGYSYAGGDVFSNNCGPSCPAGAAFLQPPSRSGASTDLRVHWRASSFPGLASLPI